MTANSIGAIPAVITFSHHIDLGAIQSTNTFLNNWYLQILGDKSKGNFNLGAGNTIQSPPTPTVGTNDLTTLAGGLPLSLANLAASNPGSILPYITSSTLPSKSDYTAAYNNAAATINQALSSQTNKDLTSDQSIFPVLWLQDIQNAQLALISEQPIGTFVNQSSGAPDPSASNSNYILGEIFVGLNDKQKDANNGDVTYIEQLGLPISLNLWYTDGQGNLYRGVQDQNGAGLSIPGAGSYISSNTYNANANNAGSLAQALSTNNPELRQPKLNATDGSLYFNPKDLYGGTPSAVVNPRYGDFYDYFTYLASLSITDYPIQWSGQFNQEQAYRVTGTTFNGFSQTGGFREYDQTSSITLSIDWGNYSTSPSGSLIPPTNLGNTANIIIPWLGVPGQPQGIAPASNQYTIANSSSNPSQPSGGWDLAWNSTSQAYSGALVTLTPLQGTDDKTSDVTPNGGYQVAGLFSFYSKLFTYNTSTISLDSTPYTWQGSGDPLLTITGLPSSPQDFGWQTITQNGQAGNVAGLQIQYQNGAWQFQGTNPNSWNGIGAGSQFSVPDGGLLPGGFNPTVTLNTSPDKQTSLTDTTFKPNAAVASDTPLTGFEVLAQDGKTVIATLTLNDTYRANQLVNASGFTYAATAAGILGANAGYYYRNSSTSNYTTSLNLQNDLYGTVVGDFLSLVNAGLPGASQAFTYPNRSGTPESVAIGKLATLDPSYSVNNGAITPSPWLDKLNGPVANGLFGSKAWQTLPQGDLQVPYSYWASLINEYAPSVYGFGLSDRFRNGYDISFNLERVDLTGFSTSQRNNFQLLQFNPSATSASTSFSLTNAANLDYLYPVFIEYQIGGFGSGTPGFLPDYPDSQVTGGLLSPEKTIALLSTSGAISDSAQIHLLTSKTRLSETSFNYTIDLDRGLPGAVVLSIELSPLTDSLDLAEADGTRRQNRHLTYYRLNADGSIAPFTYNSITRTGARFYDLTGSGRAPDGLADFLTLTQPKQESGSSGGNLDGQINQTSTAAAVDLNPTITSINGFNLRVGDPTNTEAKASVSLRANLTSRSSSVNQIGYVAIDDSEITIASDPLNSLATIKARAQILLSTLESKDVTLSPGESFHSNINLINGQSVRFFEISNGTLDELNSLEDFRFRFIPVTTTDETNASISSESGVQIGLSILNQDLGLNALIAQEQGLAAVLDFTGIMPGQTVSGTLRLGREADYDAITGFYRTLDIQGTVKGEDGGLLRPSDRDYKNAALRPENLVSSLTGLQVGDNQTSSRLSEIRESTYLAPYAQVGGHTFFAYADANSDGISHFMSLGNNSFGLEDLLGGGDRDYDDLILSFSFSQLT